MQGIKNRNSTLFSDVDNIDRSIKSQDSHKLVPSYSRIVTLEDKYLERTPVSVFKEE